ncbi:hypothetical protein ANCCAN_08865 [Ancylostoma caninum]|uniref:Uncharacterized protein n=1 Tax=Ancylostoma caninum TaxID=29170 RepID=A0A368GL53_ANCCA|nr:hypothetical protein ANCCAN_08865 [Ancylostoma caninum]
MCCIRHTFVLQLFRRSVFVQTECPPNYSMNHRAVVPFISFLFLLAIASAALLDALRFVHCESTSSFSLLYFPLFLVNNVFVTLGAFIFWILSERKTVNPTTVNRRLATRFVYTNCSVRYCKDDWWEPLSYYDFDC